MEDNLVVDNTPLNFEVMHTIFVNVMMGVGQHGDFLKHIAESWCRADNENREILKIAYRNLIHKYYLHNKMYMEVSNEKNS